MAVVDSAGDIFDRPPPKPPIQSPPSTAPDGGFPQTGYGRPQETPDTVIPFGNGEPKTPAFNPTGSLPNIGVLTNKADAKRAAYESGLIRQVWEERKSQASWAVAQEGGNSNSADSFEEGVDYYWSNGRIFLQDGSTISSEELDARIAAANSPSGSGKKKSEAQLALDMANAALISLDSYAQNALEAEQHLPADGPSWYATTGHETDTSGGGSSSGGGGGGSSSGGSAKPAVIKPTEVTLWQFMDVISGQESGGDYAITNPDSGAYGRFQIMPENWPSWSVEAGLPPGSPPTPENQDKVAAFKMQEYYNKYKNWADVASVWYSGRPISTMTDEERNAPQNGYPTIQEYVDSVMGKLPNAGGGTIGIETDPLADYLKSGEYGLEVARAKEYDRQYDDVAERSSDYLGLIGQENDLIADIMAAKAKSQDMNDQAQATAANINKLVREGKLEHYDGVGGAIWSDPLAEYIRRLKTAPEGFSDGFLDVIPKTVPSTYHLNTALGLPAPNMETWGDGTVISRYATGTGDWRDDPLIAKYLAGTPLRPADQSRLEHLGVIGPAGQEGVWRQGNSTPAPPANSNQTPTGPGTDRPVSVIPDPPLAAGAESTTWFPGSVPKNSILPSTLRVYDTGEWLDAAVSTIARGVSAGTISFPPDWGISGLDAWVGVPAAQMDKSFLDSLRAIIVRNKDKPEMIALVDRDPNIPTIYVRDPNLPPEETKKPTSSSSAPTRTTGTGFASTGGRNTTTLTGTYGSQNPGDPDLDKKLSWEKEQFKWQKEYQQATLVLQQNQDVRSAEYQAAQIKQMEAATKINEAQLELQKLGDTRQEAIFQENLRAAQVAEAMGLERLDLDKVRQASDIQFRQEELELQRQAGVLDQEEYEQRKYEFETTFGYQKEKDEKALNLERAKTTAQIMSNPNNSFQQQFWYAGMEDPVGTGYDVYTGKETGKKTYTQAYNEDAAIYADAMKPIALANGSKYGFINDVMLITGDSPRSNRATGFDEAIYNPTGAPLAVINNKDSQEIGVIPAKGKPFGKNVRKGVA